MSDTGETAEVQFVAVQGDVALRTVVTGAEEGAPCTFEVHKVQDDSVVATVQGEVQEGVAEASWDPAISPEGRERGLRVYYVVEVGDQRTRSQEVEVYLDYIEVTSLDEERSPLPDVPYRLTIGEVVREGNTGSTGTFVESGLPPGEVQLEWLGPFQLIEWMDDEGPTRMARLKKVHRLMFRWPDPERQGGRRLWLDDGGEVELQDRFHAHTQWVNLTPDPAAPEQGSRVTLRVVGVEREHVKAGDKVFVKVEWPPADQLSKRNAPARELVGGDAKPWAQGSDEKGLELAFEEDGGEASFELELGKAGGDRVTVHVGCTDRCDDAKLVITNRRKLWFQTTRMAHQALVDLDAGEQCTRAWLDAAAIDLEAEEEVVWDDAPALDGPAERRGLARVPAAWFEEGAEGERVIVGSHNWEWFKAKFLARHGPRGIHFLLADHVIWGTQGDGQTAFSQAFRIDWEPDRDEDTNEPTLSRFIFLPDQQRFELFPSALRDGGAALRGATWEVPRRFSARRFRGKRGDIPPEWVRIDRHAPLATDDEGRALSDGKKGAWIEFPADSEPGQILAAGVGLIVRGQFQPGQVGRLGTSQEFQVALTAVSDPALANFIVTHELAHNMRQAASPWSDATGAENRRFFLPPGLEFADHPHGYQGKGHHGPHCNFGLDDAGATHVRNRKPDGTDEFLPLQGRASDFDTYSRLRRKDGDRHLVVSGSCLMYGAANERSAGETIGFCEHCLKFLRAGSLEDIHGDWGVAALTDGDEDEGAAAEAEEEQEEPPEQLRVRLLDAAYAPHANAAYELTLPDGSKVSGSTDADGILEQPMPPAGPAGGDVRIKYTPEGEDELEVTVHLPGDDLDGDEAFLAHLRNIGYGAPGEPPAAAVCRFQAASGLPPTGVLDDATKETIDALFNGEQADALRRRLRREG